MRHVFDGEFQIIEELARGGMGVVYRAIEHPIDRLVALKVLPPELGLTPRAIERFRREASTVADLDHRNIVPVYRLGQIGGVSFIAMRLVEGRSLEAIVAQQGALPVETVIHVLRQVASGIAYAHQRMVVHRDVKSANILVERDGRVMISDFGVALRQTDVTLTADGTVIGTPAFMSPEQCAGLRADPASDQYALGVVAFHMLTGQVPFHADTIAGFIQHHLHSPIPDLRHVRRDLPTALLQVVNRMLLKNPEGRFPSSDEMLSAIEALPFEGVARARSSELLRRMAQGKEVERVHTMSLPVLTFAPTMLLQWGRRSWRHRLGRVGLLLVGAVVVAASAWLLGRSTKGAEATPTSTVPPPHIIDSARVDTTPVVTKEAPRVVDSSFGRIRLLTAPANARIYIDGRRAGIGGLLNYQSPAGARRLVVRAPGYVPFDTTIDVAPGGIVSVGRVKLQAQSRAP
ncbi:MAG TPA: serine/threonine-protein kinase [Gemmatimonadales bacterium]|nr:serine/threonine-protein kinase [Gemmatimonadales bacterium]